MLFSEGWTVGFNEPTRIVKYKMEPGFTHVTGFNECIVDAPLSHVIAMFSEIEIFKGWMPSVTGAKCIK